MKLLVSLDDLKAASCRQLIPIECSCCGTSFNRPKNQLLARIKTGMHTPMYCGRSCLGNRGRKPVIVSCSQCGIEVAKPLSAVQRSKRRGLVNHFCSNKCAGIYGAAHKKKGTRRAKLECWLEEQLVQLYPSLGIVFNKTGAIQAELDIYIPSLKLAFELNGVFHYEPIFGSNKLSQIQNKDRYKLHACTKAGIDLCVIDTSGVRYFKPKSSQRFLDIITRVIDDRMAVMTGLAPASVPT